LRLPSKHIIQAFQRKLLSWYFLHGRKFPWREIQLDPYRAIIAEILLQRTKAETVSKVYLEFLRKFPSWKSIVDTDIKQLESVLTPLGLYRQRARGLKALAEKMIDTKGILPQNRDELMQLPMMGQYLANAVELVLWNKPSPLLDVNMARLLERYFKKRKLADIRHDPYLQKLSSAVVNTPNALEMNWAVLDFAALVCKAVKPECEICILNEDCKYYKNSVKDK